MHKNFLSVASVLPKFSSIKFRHVKILIQNVLNNCYNTVDKIISYKNPMNWDILYYSLMIVENELKLVWSPIVHLNSVQHDNLELRKVYEDSLFSISEYRNWINQHYGLYKSYQSFYKSDSYQKCSIIQKKTVNNILINFELSGVLLSSKQKKCYRDIMCKLSQLHVSYVNNVFDATLGWNKLITDKKILSGVPEPALEMAHMQAMEHGKTGWLFTLQHSSYSAIISYCDTQELREEVYWAFNTRASDQGPNAGKWDNTKIMDEILSLRYESARILGFNNYLERSLATKMVKDPQQIFNFLINLHINICDNEKKELLEIQNFVKRYYSCYRLKPWDIAYYQEKYKQYLFSIDNEKLRFYFPETIVLNGMFVVVNRIYNITIKQRYNVDKWHPDVRFFDIYDEYDEWRGGFYLDIYARKEKCEGAWMDEFVSLMYKNDDFHQRPIAYLICNFELSNNVKKLCLLTHNDVIVLFHEFGHVLHHIMTRVDIPAISGINGVPQDVIELPSQIMEKFCWEFDVLRLISAHYITEQPLSENMINNLLQTKIYQVSSYLLRQIVYGLFDLRLHYEYVLNKSETVLAIFNEVMQKISVYPVVSWERIFHSFVHIFSNDYAAGYYSYLWSEMLALNVWRRFERFGVLDNTTGKLFLKGVLESGISIDVLKCLTEFCEREIMIEPMLRYYNIPIIL